MNKRQIIASLNKIANELDNAGLYTEASSLTNVMKKIAIDREDKVSRRMAEIFDCLDDLFRPKGGGVNEVENEFRGDMSNPSRESVESFIKEMEKQAEKAGLDKTALTKLDGVKVNFNQLLSAMMNLTKKVPSYTSKYKDPETPVDDEDM
jgi:hypothetical protein